MATVQPGPNPLGELLPPLSANEALVEANRCLFCYDAPCLNACPTHIDVPKFIKQIATGNLGGSAETIYEQNLLGATCARVCPVQELCEGACVLGTEHKPIAIGRLQRFAMDRAASIHQLPMVKRKAAGASVAVIGSGPAGLSCAGELIRLGHAATVFEKDELPGGLSTFGIIGLREPIKVAAAEVAMLRELGVTIKTGSVVTDLSRLRDEYDAVFIGVGFGGSPAMGIGNEELIVDGLAYIRSCKFRAPAVKVGRSVVVIGAGNTAVDCATIAKRLGAERVMMLYRRSEKEMTAYPHEIAFARAEGVEFQFLTLPIRIIARDGVTVGLECLKVQLSDPGPDGRPFPEPVPESTFVIKTDQVIKAIGQVPPGLAEAWGIQTQKGLIVVNAELETNIPGVFAGGDCIRAHGSASTVMAVQDGKLAAKTIARRFASPT